MPRRTRSSVALTESTTDDRLRRIAGDAAEQPRISPKVLDAVELECDRGNTGLTKTLECGPVVFARVEDDEIGLRRDDRFDARAKRRTQARDRLGRIGKRIVLRAADESLPRADGE